MEFVHPERGEELLVRARRILDDNLPDRETPPRLSADEVHQLMASFGFVEMDPGEGFTYYRYAPEHPDLHLLRIDQMGRVGDETLKRAVEMVEAVMQREGFTLPGGNS